MPNSLAKSTQPAFSVRTRSVRQGNAIQMAFLWQADSGRLFGVYWAPAKVELDTLDLDNKVCFWPISII